MATSKSRGGSPVATSGRLGSRAVPTRDSIDMQTRLRIAAKLRYLMWEGEFDTAAALARELGVHRKTMGKYLKGDRTVGLDVLLKIHRELGVSIDWMVDRDPPQEWFDPDFVPPPGYRRLPRT